MSLKLAFADTKNKSFDLSVAPDITLAQLHRLVAEKQNVKGKVSLKLNGKPVGGSLTDTLSKLSIKDGNKFTYDVAVTAVDKEDEKSSNISDDGWIDDGGDWGEFVEEGNDAGLDIVEDTPPQTEGAPPSLMRQRSYIVMGKIQIGQRQKDMLDDVCAVLNLSISKATVLLRHFKWNQENLLKEYTNNPAKCMESAGIKSKYERKDDSEIKEVKGEFECPLCCVEYPYKETYALDCGHRHCMGCWKGWFEATMVDKGQDSVFTKCMEKTCPEIVPSEVVVKTIEKKDREKYQEWINKAFVHTNTHVKWCPRPGCDKAVEYHKLGMKTVQCECGQMFCFGCGLEAHDPAPCSAVADWLKRDNSLITWLKSQKDNKDNLSSGLIKQCTKCNELIEKNQGCKHMTCKNCKHEFCWLCYQDWHGHQESGCNNYEEKDRLQEEKQSKGDASGVGLRRYQFYFSRYENHMKSIKFAERMIADTEKKMNKMQDLEGVSLNQVTFLLEAVKTVIECRRLLQWSYAWAFVMEDNSTLKVHFKMHQDMLEEFTEELSGMTEQPLAKLLQAKMREAIINHTRVIGKFRQNIIDFSKANHPTETKETKKA